MAADKHTWTVYENDRRDYQFTIEDPDTGQGMDLSTGYLVPQMIVTDKRDGERLVDREDMTAVDASAGVFKFTLDVSSWSKTLVRGRWRIKITKTDLTENFTTEPWDFILLPLEGN